MWKQDAFPEDEFFLKPLFDRYVSIVRQLQWSLPHLTYQVLIEF